MTLVAQQQQTSFTVPQNGDNMDADVVRNNSNAVVAKHNAHDADFTIHVQQSVLASRPAAATAGNGALWLTTDGRRLYRSDGATWSEVPYAVVSTANTFSATQTFSDGIDVSNEVVITTGGLSILASGFGVVGNSSITGNLTVSGTLTAGSVSGPTTVAASNVTNGTFGAGNYTFPGTLTINSTLAVTGAITAASIATDTVSGTGVTITKAAGATAFLTASTVPTWMAADDGGVRPAGTISINDTLWMKIVINGVTRYSRWDSYS
jgi:hypothetical protein